jgi:hypothetical protein
MACFNRQPQRQIWIGITRSTKIPEYRNSESSMKSPLPLLACMFTGVALLLASCGTTGDAQNHSAAPNALRAQTRFALEAIDMSSVTIDDVAEKEFRADRQPQQNASWDADKVAMRESFSKAARDTAQTIGLTIIDTNGEAPYVVRPILLSIASGGYRPFMVSKSRMKLKVIIAERSGKAVEEFVVESAVAFDLIGPQASSGGRFRLAASELGHETMVRLQKLTKR